RKPRKPRIHLCDSGLGRCVADSLFFPPSPSLSLSLSLSGPTLTLTFTLTFMHRLFVTGAAGFIGSNLVDRLLADGLIVVGWDDFSTGQQPFLEGALRQPRFTLLRGDNLDLTALTTAMQGCDFVFHLAANADIKDGWQHPKKDLEQNTIATF